MQVKKNMAALESSHIFFVHQFFAFRRVGIFYAVGVELLHFATYNLHGGVHHVVLLGEWLWQYGDGFRQPLFGEHARELTIAVLIDLVLNLLQHGFLALFGGRI